MLSRMFGLLFLAYAFINHKRGRKTYALQACRVGTRPVSAMAPVGAARSRPRGGGSAYARSPRDAWRIPSTGSRRGTGPHGRYVPGSMAAWEVCVWLHGCMGGMCASWLHSRDAHGCMAAWSKPSFSVSFFPVSIYRHLGHAGSGVPVEGGQAMVHSEAGAAV